jgi:hypothetical protein
MPSLGPAPLDTSEPIYLADVLLKSCGNQPRVFRCPNDTPGLTERDAPNGGKSYFQSERCSYQYRPFPPVMGRTILEVLERMKHRVEGVAENNIWILCDYGNFHPQPNQRRYLYIDGHVTDFEGF